MEQDTINKYEDDTIDVYDIWIKLKKKKWLVIVITLLSFVISIAYAFSASKVYKVSNILVISQDLIAPESINVSDIKPAMQQLKELSQEQLLELLNVKQSVLDSFIDYKITNVAGSSSLNLQIDTVNAQSGVKIIDAMVLYLNKLPMVHKKISDKKKRLLMDRDELKRIIDNPVGLLKLPQNSIVSEILLSQYELLKLYNNNILELNKLENDDVITLIGPTLIPKSPYKPQKKMVIMLGLLAGLFVGLFFAFVIEWFESIRRDHFKKL